jgi:hypothetical protein
MARMASRKKHPARRGIKQHMAWVRSFKRTRRVGSRKVKRRPRKVIRGLFICFVLVLFSVKTVQVELRDIIYKFRFTITICTNPTIFDGRRKSKVLREEHILV